MNEWMQNMLTKKKKRDREKLTEDTQIYLFFNVQTKKHLFKINLFH